MRSESIRQAMRAADQPPQMPPALPPVHRQAPEISQQQEELQEYDHVRSALGLSRSASLNEVLYAISLLTRKSGSNLQTARALMSALAHQLES